MNSMNNLDYYTKNYLERNKERLASKIISRNPGLNGCLANFDFGSALSCLDGESEEIKKLVKALSDTFGDAGVSGNMYTIVCHALNDIEVDLGSRKLSYD